MKSDGVGGLYHGSGLGVLRSIVASGTNLTFYSYIKDQFLLHGMKDSSLVDIIAGMVSGVATVCAVNPVDVIRTRYYNQPYDNGVGRLYKSGWDALAVILKNEGTGGLYKGVFAHWLRLGPHFTLTFLL